jgi:hypothetical protein
MLSFVRVDQSDSSQGFHDDISNWFEHLCARLLTEGSLSDQRFIMKATVLSGVGLTRGLVRFVHFPTEGNLWDQKMTDHALSMFHTLLSPLCDTDDSEENTDWASLSDADFTSLLQTMPMA